MTKLVPVVQSVRASFHVSPFDYEFSISWRLGRKAKLLDSVTVVERMRNEVHSKDLSKQLSSLISLCEVVWCLTRGLAKRAWKECVNLRRLLRFPREHGFARFSCFRLYLSNSFYPLLQSNPRMSKEKT